jgi:hypothetical protein
MEAKNKKFVITPGENHKHLRKTYVWIHRSRTKTQSLRCEIHPYMVPSGRTNTNGTPHEPTNKPTCVVRPGCSVQPLVCSPSIPVQLHGSRQLVGYRIIPYSTLAALTNKCGKPNVKGIPVGIMIRDDGTFASLGVRMDGWIGGAYSGRGSEIR